MKSIFLLTLTACSGDAFISIPEGGLPDGDPSSDSSMDGAKPGDSGGQEASDASSDATDADASCEQGTQACFSTWNAFCLRLKTCCANSCSSSWQNNGGNECLNYFLSNASVYCSSSRMNDKRCDEPCMSDIQAATCTAIKTSASISGLTSLSSTCLAYWQ